MGKHYSKMQCSVRIAALSTFGTQTKIVQTGVRSRVTPCCILSSTWILVVSVYQI